MSLRTDIHAAFEAITPLTGGLEERVVETARREARVRERRRKFMLRLRAPIALVAVVVLIAIVAAAIVGGRLIQGWYGPHTVSPPHLPSLSELENRPWQHQLVAASESCLDSHYAGPVAAFPETNSESAWGIYSTGRFVLGKGLSGPLMVRVRDARTGITGVFITEHAAGGVVGTDIVDGVSVAQHKEAVFDTSGRPNRIDGVGQKVFVMTMGMKHGFSGCFQWQVDGTLNGKPFGTDSYYSGPPG
ncbi:MAG TPA: hypothetical protein VJR46_12235 [Candidatus Dormibacteraeota bacterium]|nr:hypothetical protein [Candidatus Dormibacteraeota bacterium]